MRQSNAVLSASDGIVNWYAGQMSCIFQARECPVGPFSPHGIVAKRETALCHVMASVGGVL